jgi:hypothetical protein
MQKQDYRADRRGRRQGCRSRRGRRRLAQVAVAAATLETLEARRLLAADVVISEFLASNDDGLQDSFGNRGDWIEIHNAGDAPADLSDYYLTDNASEPTKWRFPSQAIAPAEYLVVFASDRNLAVAGQELHTNFALSAGGEYLGLIRASDFQPQFEYAPSFPGQSSDISYGLSDSDDRNSARIFFSVPTPGAVNAPSVPTPTLTPGQTFSSSVQVTISTAMAGATIYYTTDNTMPTAASTVYSGPITLTGSAIVRAIAAAPGHVDSPVTHQSYTAVDSSVNAFRSNLPIVVLESFGQTFNDQTFVNASATFIDTAAADGYADMLDAVDWTGRIGLRYRGSTSFFNYPKKPFAVEVRDEANGDKNASILGMPAESAWVLYSPWTERSLMNNALAMDWARQMGHYASRIRLVELYLNNDTDTAVNYDDDYLGVYILMEKPKLDDNRVDINEVLPTATTEPEITGGYFFKKDRKETAEIQINTTGGPEVATQPFVMVEPAAPTSPQLTYLTNYLNELDAVMQSPSFADPVNGYAKYIDVDSWVDFWIMNEFTKNADGFWLSTFYYKPQGGKIHMGPVWDFNLAFGQFNYRNGGSAAGYNHESLTIHATFGDQYGYFKRLFDDPDFQIKVADRWQELRKTVLNTPKMMADMDAYVALLTDNNGDYPVGPGAPTQPSTNPAIRNFKRWPVLGIYSTTNSYFDPQGRWIEDINMMKSWITARAAWMDSQFVPPPLVTPPGGTFTGTTNVTITPKAQASGIDTVLLGPGAAARAIVPSGNISGWQQPGFDDDAWPLSGTTGVGYDTTVSPVNYLPQIGLNVGPAMQNVRTSVFIRVEFNIADPSAVGSLILKMKYDDGFFAWVNGVRVIEAGAPENNNPVFTTAATTARDENAALQYVEFDISSVKPLLVAGTNVLAIQGMNNTVGSNDLLIVPEIVSRQYTNATAGSVYYTTDGSDPRDPGGAIGATAQLYAGAIPISSNTRIRARTLHGGGVWSGIADEFYELAGGELRVTELMYNPAAPPPGGAFPVQDFEWIEIKNVGTGPLDLDGLAFTVGVTYTFPDVTLAPGEYAVIVKNLAAFQSRYPDVPPARILAGVFGGALDNGGETLTVTNVAAEVVHSFTYDDAWYVHTDGGGYSMVIRDPAGAESQWNAAGGWRSSEQPHGLPGVDDTDMTTPTLQSATFDAAAKTITYVFSEPVTLTPAAGAGLTVTDVMTSTPITPTGSGAATATVTVTLAADLADGIYSAVFTAPSITDFAGHALAAQAAHAFLYVADGQTLLVPPSSSTYLVNQLEIGAGGRLDLKDNSLALDYAAGATSPIGTWSGGAYSGMTGLIESARTLGGTWDGPGIGTSMQQAAEGLTGLAIAEAADLLFLSGSDTALWDGHPVDATTVIVKYTYVGDADLNGFIDAADYGIIDNWIQFPGTSGYANGDFNYDGVIDAADYGYIDNSIQLQGPPL